MLVNQPVHGVLMTADGHENVLFELGVGQIRRAVGGSNVVEHGEYSGKGGGKVDFYTIINRKECFFD